MEELLDLAYKRENWKKCTSNCSDICMLFFSSNGLYFPNTQEEIQRIIYKQDRYEWENTSKRFGFEKRVGKMIYIRDIWKNWYVSGINEKMGSVDEVVVWLRKECESFKVITVGSSGGVYGSFSGVYAGSRKSI